MGKNPLLPMQHNRRPPDTLHAVVVLHQLYDLLELAERLRDAGIVGVPSNAFDFMCEFLSDLTLLCDIADKVQITVYGNEKAGSEIAPMIEDSVHESEIIGSMNARQSEQQKVLENGDGDDSSYLSDEAIHKFLGTYRVIKNLDGDLNEHELGESSNF